MVSQEYSTDLKPIFNEAIVYSAEIVFITGKTIILWYKI